MSSFFHKPENKFFALATVIFTLCLLVAAYPVAAAAASIAVIVVMRVWWVRGNGRWSRRGWHLYRQSPNYPPSPSFPGVPAADAPIVFKDQSPAVYEPAATSVAGSTYRFDEEEQLAVIDQTDLIKKKRILIGGEVQIFYGALDALHALHPQTKGWHLHAQPAMGEFLAIDCENGCEYWPEGKLKWRCSGCQKIYQAFNSKRPDMLICNARGEPMIAIEHQGKGHIDQSSAVAAERSKLRNEVKMRVLEKAGIRLLETEPGTSKVAAMGMVYATICEALDDDAASDGILTAAEQK